jgi:hypothetical protein
MITVETTDAAVCVTIPKNDVPEERLKSFLDSLRLEAVASRSNLTENEAARLADEIKASWWADNKHWFIKPA